MAIDVHCPFCDKPYKLKDDLAGKKVTCANGNCRKVFTVTPSANGSAKPAPAKAPPKPAAPPPDAETLAAAAFAEEGEAAPEDTRMIEMTCTMCEHTWAVPWAMQGKNVLCPACKVRQKVPVQKKAGKADWRDSRNPSMAKVEKLEGVVASQDNTFITGQTIREAGLVEVEYEPRPITFWLKWVSAGLAGVIVLGMLIAWTVRSRQERKQDELVEKAMQSLDSAEMKGLPANVSPLFRAALLTAAGEHEARVNTQEKRDRAVRYFGDAREELEKAPKGADRDALFGELAVAVLALGGTGDQVREHTKLPWVPVQRTGRVQIKPSQAEAEGVQGPLRRAFESMLGTAAEFDLRAATARRVARELIRHDQIQMLLDTLHGFSEAEQPEVRGQIGLELLRAGNAAKAREVGEGLKASQPNWGSASAPSAQALWNALEPPITGFREVAGKPSGGDVADPSRLSYTALAIVQKKPTEALETATKPGKPEGRLRALALAAEWADQPAPFVEEAARVAEREWAKREAERSLPSGQVMIRLARAAVRAGQPDNVEPFLKTITDAGLVEWAKAEVFREKLRANPAGPAKDDDAPLPDDPKRYKVGHAWARLHLARHNAVQSGDRGLAAKYHSAWPTNTIAPFGLAGVALGLQDSEAK